MMMETIYKSVDFKKSDVANYDFQGWLAKYGNVDRHDDIISEGAFKESIKRKKYYVLLENHNSEKKIGYLKAEDRKEGVYIYGKFFENDQEAIKVKQLVKVGAYSDMSVGLGVNDLNDVKYSRDDDVWIIKKAYIREGSIVLAPANAEAVITSVKSLINKNEEGENMPKNYDLEIKEKQVEIEKLEKEKAKLSLDVDKADENSDLELIKTKSDTISEIDKAIEIEKSEIEKLHYEKSEARSQLEIIRGKNEMSQKTSVQKSVNTENPYMKSEKALKDFSQLFVKCANSNDDFEKAWAKNLRDKGITNTDVFTPPAYTAMIEDCIEKSGELYNLFTKVRGQSYWKEVTEVGKEIGQGHKPGTAKVEQDLTFAAKEIVTQFIYKYIPVDKKALRDAAKNTTGVNPLLQFVTKELVDRVIHTIEKAAYIGDGLLPTDDKKITSIEPIVKADPTYVTKIEKSITTDSLIDADTLEDLVTSISSKFTNNLVMAMHRTVASALRKVRDNNGNKEYEQGTTLINGVTYKTLNGMAYVERDWMPTLAEAKASAGVDYIIMNNYSQFKMLEDSAGMEFYRNFVLKANQEEFLAEMNCGGAQFGCESAAFLSTIA